MILWEMLGIMATGAAVVLAGGAAVVVRDHLNGDDSDPDPVQGAKLEAYEDVMSAIVELNRTAVSIDEEQFYQEADKLLMDKESVLEEPHSEVSATYQRYYHLLDKEVYEAASDYVNYLVEYHEDGAQVGELLTLGGKVGAAMREELGKSPLGREPPGTGEETP